MLGLVMVSVGGLIVGFAARVESVTSMVLLAAGIVLVYLGGFEIGARQ